MHRRLSVIVAALALAFLTQAAPAQEITGARLNGYGIFQAQEAGTEYKAQGDTQRDVVSITDVQVVDRTDRIPLHEPIIIGLEYEVHTTEGPQSIVVDLVVQKPNGSSVMGKARIDTDTPWNNTYHLNDIDNKDVGDYTFSVNFNGRRLVSKTFHMYR